VADVRRRQDAKMVAKTSVPRNSAGQNVISLKVTLRGPRPPVWRRLLVPGTMTLGGLHRAIGAAMGWHDTHLHLFEIDGRDYGDPHTVDDVADENRVTLNGLLRSGVARFAYTYDFGDHWEHTIAIEKTRPAADGDAYPLCVAGRRNCPPEDCGGPWGYQHLLEVLADPTNPDYAEQSEWVGEEFNPDAFDIDTANAVLNARFKRK